MKRMLLLLLCALILGCGKREREINKDQIEIRSDNLYYVKDESQPFTGEIVETGVGDDYGRGGGEYIIKSTKCVAGQIQF